MLADIIVIAILVVIVALVIRTIIKSKKAGKRAVINPRHGVYEHRMGISWKELICRLSCICRHR